MYSELYNIMADIIGYLISSKDFDITTYQTKSHKWHERMMSHFQSLLPFYFDDSTPKQFLRSEEISDVIDIITPAFETYKMNKSTDEMIFLLYLLDCFVKSKTERFSTGEMISLNSNYQSTGVVLLPYFQCLWERKSRGQQHGFDLNHCIHNTYFIQLSHLQNFSLQHFILEERTFINQINDHVLRIGISSLTQLKTVCGIKKMLIGSNQYFTISDIINKDKISELVLKTLEEAKKQKIDILVFPELTGNEQLSHQVKNILENNNTNISYPPLIILPGFIENGENYAEIFINEGQHILKQYKQYPMIFDSHAEYIIPDRHIYVLHSPTIGRICIAICKDFLTTEYLDILIDEIKAKMIIVPSFSTGSYDFERQLGRCESTDTDVIWVNSCSAKHLSQNPENNFRFTGVVTKNGKNSAKRDYLETSECQNRCCFDICLYISEIKTQA